MGPECEVSAELVVRRARPTAAPRIRQSERSLDLVPLLRPLELREPLDCVLVVPADGGYPCRPRLRRDVMRAVVETGRVVEQALPYPPVPLHRKTQDFP